MGTVESSPLNVTPEILPCHPWERGDTAPSRMSLQARVHGAVCVHVCVCVRVCAGVCLPVCVAL